MGETHLRTRSSLCFNSRDRDNKESSLLLFHPAAAHWFPDKVTSQESESPAKSLSQDRGTCLLQSLLTAILLVCW